MQGDGNLVVYYVYPSGAYKVLFASNTSGYNGAFGKMQDDGNFVIYNVAGTYAPGPPTRYSSFGAAAPGR